MSKSIPILFFSLALIFLIQTYNIAENEETDIDTEIEDTDLFDDLFEETETKEKDNRFRQLSKNFNGKSSFRYSLFFDNLTVIDPVTYGEPDAKSLFTISSSVLLIFY